jgi:hypothetical protein
MPKERSERTVIEPLFTGPLRVPPPGEHTPLLIARKQELVAQPKVDVFDGWMQPSAYGMNLTASFELKVLTQICDLLQLVICSEPATAV